jgi:hypothetical protein
MKSSDLGRLGRVAVIGTLSFLVTGGPVRAAQEGQGQSAQDKEQERQKAKEEQQRQQQAQPQARQQEQAQQAARQQAQQQQQQQRQIQLQQQEQAREQALQAQHPRPATPQQRQAQAQQQQQAQAQQAARQQRESQQQAQLAQQRLAQQQEIQQQQAQQRQQEEQRQLQQQRLSEARQQQLIDQQRQRTARYDQALRQDEARAQQRAQALQQQQRQAQYRYQQRYLDGLREQQLAVERARSYDYGSDPFFYSAPIYRYSYSGRNYDVNQYGANQLRQSVNNGYEEGYRAGQADREDRWRHGYQDLYPYQDANYGYTGLYVDQAQYNYYFRQGFQRGYDDGFYGQSQYGRSTNGSFEVLGSILSKILTLRPLG